MSTSLDDLPRLAGKKRKRYLVVEEDISVKLAGKLHHYLREMRQAAKKSKSFEMRRIVKKLKHLRKSAHASETAVLKDLEDLEAQLHSLKKSDYERIAYLALSSKIHKDGKLRSNDVLMASLTSAISNTTNANTEARHAKVESRLLSSKIIAAEAQEAVKGLRTVLEPQNMIATADGSGVQNLDLNDSQERVKDEENEEQAESANFISNLIGGRGSEDRNEGEPALQEEVVDDDDDLVGDDGWESGSIDGIEHAKSGGVDDNEEGDEFISPRQKARQLSSLILEPLKSSNLAATSTFLPSLSVGYVKGDSDSDAGPSDDETAASGRKNRRGQRARQAIWEKKYGKNAKHLQGNEAQSSATARGLDQRFDKGWAGRRSDPPTRIPARATNDKRFAQAHSRSQPERHLSPPKPVHPSWEAKRRLKEKESARILPAQGKKIVFN